MAFLVAWRLVWPVPPRLGERGAFSVARSPSSRKALVASGSQPVPPLLIGRQVPGRDALSAGRIMTKKANPVVVMNMATKPIVSSLVLALSRTIYWGKGGGVIGSFAIL